MREMIMIMMAIGLVVLTIIILLKEKKIQMLQKELGASKNSASENETWKKNDEEFQNELWQSLNAIHIYAHLSEEEARSQSVKEKQKEILNISESILEKMKVKQKDKI